MSLLGKALKGALKLATKASPLLAATPAGRVLTGVTAVGAALGAAKKASGVVLPALRSLPGAGAVAAAGGAGGRIGGVVRTIGKGAGAAATGYAIYDAAGNLIGHKRKGRRMNPMNYRALRRAARRIKAARKFVKLIDSVGHPKARHHFSRSK